MDIDSTPSWLGGPIQGELRSNEYQVFEHDRMIKQLLDRFSRSTSEANGFHPGWIEPEPDNLIYHLSEPSSFSSAGAGVISVRGWCAANEQVHRVVVGDTPLTMMERPDARAAHPLRNCVTGFEGAVPVSCLGGGVVEIRFFFENRSIVRFHAVTLNDAALASMRRRRRELIEPLFVCPLCYGSLEEKQSYCSACALRYSHSERCFNFLPQHLREVCKVDATERVSANEYDPVALGVIGATHEGLVLDCGAGLRSREFPNVVNYEIVAYPSTDVLGVNERLPFRDASFDAVLSLSVLEHVRNPMQSAAEISRVLKPGGTLYCSVPFLQPLHGYPHHYFNMTTEGLKSLFEETVEFDDAGVVESGVPIWTLTWFLRSWIEGLQGPARERFLSMRVKDLIGAPQTYLREPFVTTLSQEKNVELGSSTVVLGRKRSVEK